MRQRYILNKYTDSESKCGILDDFFTVLENGSKRPELIATVIYDVPNFWKLTFFKTSIKMGEWQ